MIDTDKYENITPERWTVDEEDPCRVMVSHLWNAQECTIARTDFVDIDEEREWQLANAQLIADAPLLLKEVKNQNYQLHLYQSALRQMQEDTLKVVSDWFDSDENEWRRLEQALGLPLTPLSWEGEE